MLDLLTIALEAHREERNHHRRYELSVARDLLDHWVVTVRYGRVGTPLLELRTGGPHVEGAKAVVEDRLRRRLSAPRRIGCRYRITGLASQNGLNLSDWVSTSLLSSFL